MIYSSIMRSTPGTRGTFTEDARRAQIVECATEVISELGYGAASIRKIADRVGIAMSVVLYHFANKDDLVGAIVDRGYRSMLATMLPAVGGESTAAGKVRAYITAYVDYMEANRALLQALAEISSNYRSREGLRLDQLSVAPDIAVELTTVDLETILTAGHRDGEFQGLSARSVAIAVRGALDGSVAVIMRDPDFDARGYREDVTTMFNRIMRSTR
jgi:AcrR family transcriptional regulator